MYNVYNSIKIPQTVQTLLVTPQSIFWASIIRIHSQNNSNYII